MEIQNVKQIKELIMKQKHVGDKFPKVENPVIGNKYHLSWANAGAVWKLLELSADGFYCTLETPKTKKKLKAKREDLRHLNDSPIRQKYPKLHKD